MDVKKQYVCPTCLADLKTSTAFKRHQQRKKPCQRVAEKIDAAVSKGATKVLKSAVANEMLTARDILRAIGIINAKAGECVTSLLILRQLEKLNGADALVNEKNFKKGLNKGRVLEALKNKWTLFSELCKVTPATTGTSIVTRITRAFEALRSHQDGDGNSSSISLMLEQFKEGDLFPLNGTRKEHNEVACKLLQHCAKKFVFKERPNDLGADVLGEGFSSNHS